MESSPLIPPDNDSQQQSTFSHLSKSLPNKKSNNTSTSNHNTTTTSSSSTGSSFSASQSPTQKFIRLTSKISTLLRVTKRMKNLPPIESTSVILIRFTPKASKEEYVDLIKERLQEAHVEIVADEFDSDGNVILGISTTQKELEIEAEHLSLSKPKTLKNLTRSMSMFEGTTIMDQFEVADRDAFLNPNITGRDDFALYDRSGIFSSADRVKIVHSLMESLTVLKPGVQSSLLSLKLNESLNFPKSEVSARYYKLYLFDTLRREGLIDTIIPVHSTNLKQNICAQTLNFTTSVPLDAFKDYYGAEVAFYFAWMQFYVKALLFPGISGLIIFVLRTTRGGSIDTDTLTPFHGLLTFVWAICFTQFWSREEARLAYKWGTKTHTPGKETFTVRHEFQGIMRVSEVTKMKEKYYSPVKRRMNYFVSALITLILLAGAFLVMILSLNMQGYIKHKHDTKSWYMPVEEECHHPFHFEFFAKLSEKGGIFDASSSVRSTLAVILHVAMVLSMNMGYRTVAEKLTDWENHESQVTYNNSLIFKRFFFEAFDAYLVLMYLAFYEQDVSKVRSELVNVFNVDTFRRLLLEGVIPFISTKMRLRSKTKINIQHKKTDKDNDFDQSPMEEEANKEDYEEFDDYIEMIIQLGYICLFASAYPLAPFVAIIANMIELRLDAFKITHVHRRPWAVPVQGIGVWSTLIKCIVWFSAITNCMIFCFSSMQMVQYLPQYFVVDESGEHNLKDGNGWVVVFILFGIERLLLVTGILLALVIPAIPEDVRIKEQQTEYIQMRMHHLERSKADRTDIQNLEEK